MTKLFSVLCFLWFSLGVQAAEDCGASLKVYAIDSVKEILMDDWQHENKIGSKNLSIEIGEPRIEKNSKFSSRTVAGYWVPIKVKSGDKNWDLEKLFLLGKHCTRNTRAELEAGTLMQMKKSKEQK